MKHIKNFIVKTVITVTMMTIPTLAGQCELQTDCPIYTVKEGQTLTDEEQRAIEATIDYFIEHPEEDYIEISSKDFPSLSIDWYTNITKYKLNYLTDIYLMDAGNGTQYLPTTLTEPVEQTNYDNGRMDLTIKNKHIAQAIKTQNFVNYSYHVLPQLSIYNGMDEIEAIEILNNFVCDLITYDIDSRGDYVSIYESHKGVCNDYAYLFRALAQGAGIEAYYVVGSDHAWNQVIIDDVAYELDCCHNDYHDLVEERHYLYLLSREQASTYSSHETIIATR